MLTDENRSDWNNLTGLVQEYLRANDSVDTPVVNYHRASELKELLNLELSEAGADNSTVMHEIKNYLKYSVRTSHPQFNNQLYGGFNFEALMGEVISYITNTSMATFEIAPVATLIEKKLIEELNQKIGYRQGGGIMVTGGSNANMLAIHCARNNMFPKTKSHGNLEHDFCIYISRESHYSFQKAVMLMGIGTDNLITVDTDSNGKMLAADLEAKIRLSIEARKTPLVVASTCGTTVKGAFDPIIEIQRVAEKFNLWHHIDGAWGGAALFSEKIKDHFEGAHLADSFTFDAHKLLGTGVVTSFLLTKDKDSLKSANGGGSTQYIFHPYDNAEYDSGRSSLQCGRKVDALKLWLSWKAKGHRGIAELIDGQLDQMNFFKNLVNEHPRLKLVAEPEYLNVCFQVLPAADNSNININQYNLDLRFKLVQTGRFLVNYSIDPDGTIFFRQVFANNITSKEDLVFFIDHLTEIAH